MIIDGAGRYVSAFAPLLVNCGGYRLAPSQNHLKSSTLAVFRQWRRAGMWRSAIQIGPRFCVTAKNLLFHVTRPSPS